MVELDRLAPSPSVSAEDKLASKKASEKKATKSPKKLAKEKRRQDKRSVKDEANALASKEDEAEALDTSLRDLARAPASEQVASAAASMVLATYVPAPTAS